MKESSYFQIKEFQEEKDMFYLLLLISHSDEKLIFSDKKNYIIARSNPGLPVWIWSKDNLSQELIMEIEKIIKEHYLHDEITPFTCKKELYEALEKNFECSDYFEMGFLSCLKVKNIKKIDGFLDHPNYGDKTTLAKYWQNNEKELQSRQDITFENALEEVEDWLENDNFYVWRNQNGKIVSMASFGIEENFAKITHVYTPKEERCKGYCTNLIHSLTINLLQEGLHPILYTDYHYLASNHTYQKVGFQDQGFLINFKIKRRG